MKRIVIYTGLAGMLFVCSCDKHNVLLAERARVEAEIKQCQDEMAAIDAKVLPFGVDLSIAQGRMETQVAAGKARLAGMEQELAALSKKCSEGEAAMKTLRAQLDAYKAKFVR